MGDSDDENEIMTNKQFDACFKLIDDDGNGAISKEEMLTFFKMIS